VLDRFEQRSAARRVAKAQPAFAAERPDPGLDRGHDRMPQVEHIVILMMENHSYDNYLGCLAGRGDGLELGSDGLPHASNVAGDGREIPLRHGIPNPRNPAGTVQKPGTPSQSWHASHIQFDNGSNDGFVRSIEETLPGADATVPMTYWTEEDLPFYYSLARTFPLASRWFSSCLGPTFPNRRFMIAGTAHGLIDDLPFGMADYPEAGTIFDQLTAHGIPWANYHHLSPFKLNLKGLLRARGVDFFRALGALIASIVPQLLPYVQSKLQATATLFPLGLLSTINHLRSIDEFWIDARAGTLPAVSIVDPDFGTCSEENPQDIHNGEGFAARVIDAVMQGKAWSNTLLIWLYDEHGGYYDHVVPPPAPSPDDEPARDAVERVFLLRLLRNTAWGKQIVAADTGPTTFDRFGFRVPAVIVSPFARPDCVCTRTYDHTSILRVIEHKWNLPGLTKRDAAANDPIDEAVDFESPPAFLDPPTLAAPAKLWRG
jgi:phospholipase C